MICIESLGEALPTARSGRIVGISTYRGDYFLVACEFGLYKVWDDGLGDVHVERTSDSAGESQ